MVAVHIVGAEEQVSSSSGLVSRSMRSSDPAEGGAGSVTGADRHHDLPAGTLVAVAVAGMADMVVWAVMSKGEADTTKLLERSVLSSATLDEVLS